ncbi:MAG: gliding motility-associated C-terminal domain-containing protein [Bacteroidota bacterium]
MNSNKSLLIILLLATVFNFTSVLATHNRAGEITYERLGQFLYKATITTYTKTSSPADRPELELFWGDGTSSILQRASAQDQFGGPGSDIRRNIYTGIHTYPGPSVYTLYFEDPNRNGGVINIPNSINVPFYVESQLIISAFLGFNNSPVLLQPPIDQGVIGQPFVHNPNAYDPDGDSLSYHLIPCKGAGGISIGGYSFPQSSISFELDSITGDLKWLNPINCGEYNIAFLIKEWRNGVQIGFVERDMQVNISCNNPSSNAPPSISPVADLCVTAGDLVTFSVSASDPDATDLVTLTATGGPLEVTIAPATFNQPISGAGTVTSTFSWQTACNHVRIQPWQMVFKAEDNDPFVNLADLVSMRITVVAPAPQNLSVVPTGNAMSVSWSPSICTEAKGYGLYRRTGFFGFIPAPCETGVPAYTGYVRIASLQGLSNTSFLDNNGGVGLAAGTDYCYLVVAEFDDGGKSYASQEVCAVLEKELPVLTNASIVTTDGVNGQVYLAWSKPVDLDTIQFPAPHSYSIQRSPGISSSTFQTIGTNTGGLNDTIFLDIGVNTASIGYTYRIVLFASQNGTALEVGASTPGSTVFLSATGTDNKVLLQWNVVVPWINSLYTVYRFNGATFDSIGVSNTTTFVDSLLENGQTYCYKIRTTGSYSAPGYIDPIINFSQEACATPIDNVPPCPPNAAATQSDCEAGSLLIEWPAPGVDCGGDIAYYTIGFSPDAQTPFQVLQVINDGSQSSWAINDSSISGCYFITATDTSGNTSTIAGNICVEYCPFYDLPNVFTPDADGINDLFIPFPYRDVESVELKIFNRWGMEVFKTDDPDVLWNGKTANTGDDLPSGTYYFICKVEEKFIVGNRKREIKGPLQLLR